jgi:transcriptional regulator with XRE-family HTH domain
MPKRRTRYGERLLKRIGERLRTLRERLDKEQEDIAREVGVSQSLVSRWEHGAHAPPLTYFPILAKVYGINDAGEFARYLLTDTIDDEDDDRLWRVGTGQVIVLEGFYACERCGDVRYFNDAFIAPKCSNCGETVWKRRVL